jgi:hypothetical protein
MKMRVADQLYADAAANKKCLNKEDHVNLRFNIKD